jgi:type IV pilus assembly protein PilQ
MHASRPARLRSTRAAQAARALILCAWAWLVPAGAGAQQQPGSIPFLQIPSGAPPAEPKSTLTVEEALGAVLLQAAGNAGGNAAGEALPPGMPAPGPAAGRPNPFAARPAAPGEVNRLLPFNPAQVADNVRVTDDQDGLISLAVREGSLRHVVAMVAETQKLNLVFAGPGDTTVTANFDRQPWQVVLDALTASSGHTWTTSGNVVYVSSMEVANFMPPDAGGQRVEIFPLDFASAVDVDAAVKGLLSPAGRSWMVQINPESNRQTLEAVEVSDFPVYLDRIRDYIAQIDQPPRQVYIQAHILQVELTDKCRNGINFENIIRASSTPIRLQNVGFANPTPNSAFLVNVDGDGVNGLDGIIELLQSTTDAKTLASPEIHAVSGQFARLQIGEQLPYRSTATTQTAALESVQFLDVGVVLEVTPRVTRDGRVMMRIKPEVSTGAFLPEADGLPSKKTSQVETDVLMCSGQGIVIGGLISETDSNIQAKVPFLGDIPYLGVLFQRRDVELSRKEIIVTLRPFVLPYTPVIQDMQDHRVWRTEQPLTQGAIIENPRPYEPAMRDVFDHHKYKYASHITPVGPPWGNGELLALPPVEVTYGDAVELLPPGVVVPEPATDPMSSPPSQFPPELPLSEPVLQ